MKVLGLHNEMIAKFTQESSKVNAAQVPCTTTSPSMHDRNQRGVHRAIEELLMGSLIRNNKEDLIRDIEIMIDECPEDALVYDDRGRLPIHVACQEGAPLRLIQHLFRAWPDTIETPTKDERKMIPLHMVCRYYNSSNKQKSATIRYFLQMAPWTARTKTAAGETVLHLLLQNFFCTLPDVRLIIDTFPEALNLQTYKRRKSPLHVACEKHYMERCTKRSRPKSDDPSSNSADVIRLLLERTSPDMLLQPNARGELPLHTAVRSHQSVDTITRILTACPDAIQFVDNRGQTALHLATARQVPCRQTVLHLIQADPGAANQPDYKGNLPRMRAKA